MKIISLQPSITLTLDRLGRLDMLAACTKYCLDAVPALHGRGLPVVRDSWSTSAEELLPVRPDLVMASVPYRQESLTAILKAGCPVLTLVPHTLEDIYQDIRLIASIVHAVETGEALIAEMQTAVAAARQSTDDSTARPLVYCEEWGKPLIHSQLWVKELVEAAGGNFLGTPGAVTTAEAVADADPDVMITAWCGAGDRVPLERIVEQREWQDLRAVRSGRVFCIADELLNTPAHTLLGGLRAIEEALRADSFEPNPGNYGLRRIALGPDASKWHRV